MMTPEQLAQGQLDAYNARDLDGFCKFYATDVMVRDLPSGQVQLQGMEQFRARYTQRFSSTGLHAKVTQRMVQGAIVIDQEEIVGIDPSGNIIHAIAVYEAKDGLIQNVWFIR